MKKKEPLDMELAKQVYEIQLKTKKSYVELSREFKTDMERMRRCVAAYRRRNNLPSPFTSAISTVPYIYQRIVADYQNGMNVEEIAKKQGKTVQNVKGALKRAGIPERGQAPKVYTVEEHGPIWHKMHLGRGLTATVIAHREGCEHEVVRSILRQYREALYD